MKWNNEVNEDVADKFFKWLDNLKYLSQITIPRHLFENATKNDNEHISIHSFCDARGSAYAAVSYLRIENESGVDVRFIQTKS